MKAGRSPSRTAARTRRRSTLPIREPANPNNTWKHLNDSLLEMLLSYKEVLGYYAKWANFTEDYLPCASRFKSKQARSALDVVVEIAAQRNILEKLGAGNELFQVAEALEPDLQRKPERLVEQQAFAERVERLTDALVLKHPKTAYPVEAEKNREKIKGGFNHLAKKTTARCGEVKRYCSIFSKQIKRAVLDRRNLPADLNDATPLMTKNTEKTPSEQIMSTLRTLSVQCSCQGTVRAERRALQKELQESRTEHALEDSARPKGKSKSHAQSPFNSPVACGSGTCRATEDAEVQSLELKEGDEEKGPLDVLKDQLEREGYDEEYIAEALAEAVGKGGMRTPSPVPSTQYSDGSTVCATPPPVKGRDRASIQMDSLQNNADWREPEALKVVVDATKLPPPPSSGGRDNKTLQKLENETLPGTSRRRSRPPEEEAPHSDVDSQAESPGAGTSSD